MYPYPSGAQTGTLCCLQRQGVEHAIQMPGGFAAALTAKPAGLSITSTW